MAIENIRQATQDLQSDLKAWDTQAHADQEQLAPAALSLEEIVSLKKELMADSELCNAVCSCIAVSIRLQEEEHDEDMLNKVNFAFQSGMVTLEIADELDIALTLPDSEWPEEMFGPEIVAQALTQVRDFAEDAPEVSD